MNGFQHVMVDAGNVCLWGASAGIVIWVVQYTVLASWWRDFIGVTIIGEALCLLGIFIPSLIALADPAMSGFASTTWYLYLSVVLVVLAFGFVLTRIITWEAVRRQRDRVLPGSGHQKQRG